MTLANLSISRDVCLRFGGIYSSKNGVRIKNEKIRSFIREQIRVAEPIPPSYYRDKMDGKISFFKDNTAIYAIDILENRLMSVLTCAEFAQERVMRSLFKSLKRPLFIQPVIDMSNVIFTAHALDRFVERYKEIDQSVDREILARSLLAGSKEDKIISKRNRINRIINNGFTGAQYYLTSTQPQYRFVIVPDELERQIVLTFEPLYRY